MARAAVKAKKAQQAQAQAVAKPSRKQRKHASGGNPNQDLFFSRLRRKQKWVFIALAVVFAISFAALGVGSGNGGGLEQMFSGIFGGGSDPVAQAQAEIKKGLPQGYKDLANAYVTKGDLPLAISSLQSYLKLKNGREDPAAWAQLAGFEKQQADKSYEQYQQIQQANQLEASNSIFQPTGDLASKLGTNPIDEYYAQQNTALLTPLSRNITTSYTNSLAAYKQAAKFTKGTLPRANAWLTVYSAAQLAGNNKDGLAALKHYVALVPNAANIKQIEAACKRLGGSCVPKHTKK